MLKYWARPYDVYVKSSTGWVTVSDAYVRVNGAWTKVFGTNTLNVATFQPVMSNVTGPAILPPPPPEVPVVWEGGGGGGQSNSDGM